MGVEHGGSSQEDAPGHRRKVDHVDGVPVRDTSAPEPAALQSEGMVQVPVEVFDRVQELERQLAEAQAKADRLEQRRATDRDRNRRWYHKDPEHARALSNARVKAHRERKRQAGA
jgi:hypothetical protein